MVAVHCSFEFKVSIQQCRKIHQQRVQAYFSICQQNSCSSGTEMSQSLAVRKRKLLHIWRKSEGMTQCASE